MALFPEPVEAGELVGDRAALDEVSGDEAPGTMVVWAEQHCTERKVECGEQLLLSCEAILWTSQNAYQSSKLQYSSSPKASR